MVDTVIAPGQSVAISQLAGSNIPQVVDVSSLAVNAWQANAHVAASGLMRPTSANQTGFVYQASAQGQTGNLEPAWPKTAGGTVTDGSITWTAIVPPAAGADSIQSVTWTQESPPDSTLTITSQTNDTLTATAYIGGGTSGNVYTVKIDVTMTSGAIWGAELVVTIL